MKLVLIGIQGSGKSTQGNLLSKQLKIPYLSTGHIFREIAKKKTSLGKYVKTLLSAGVLIPDDKTIEIVESYLKQPEYQNGYILDGFPRTSGQAKKFSNNVDKVIYVDLEEQDALWRIAYRNDSARDDETLPAIRKRIELFKKVTMPVVRYYEKQGKLIEVDGSKSIKEINKEILKSLGKQLVKNQVKAWEHKKKAIIAIVGLSGSGKTEAANFFKEKKLPIISFGETINTLIEEKGLLHHEDDHRKLREGLREKHGMEALALLNKEKITEALKASEIVVIDGLYSWEEYTYLKKTFPKVKIYLLALFADKKIRYRRVSKRKYRPGLASEDRDVNEIIHINKAAPIAFADFLVKNNFSVEDLYDKLEHVYRRVYFG